MRRAGDAAAAVLVLAACCAPARAQTVDLRGGGAFDTVSIAGFLVPIDDVEEMEAAGILEFDPEAGRFAFADRITSEARLKAELGALPLQDARAVRDLYRAAKVPLPNGVANTLTVPSGFGPATRPRACRRAASPTRPSPTRREILAKCYPQLGIRQKTW
jgi:hypothetical protein